MASLSAGGFLPTLGFTLISGPGEMHWRLSKIHDRQARFSLIIIHCQQQVSKDNYHSFQKDNSGHCAISVIDSFCCAGRLKLICFTCKVRKMRKNVGTWRWLVENMNKWCTTRTLTSDNLITAGCIDCIFCLDALICWVSALWQKWMMHWLWKYTSTSQELFQRDFF